MLLISKFNDYYDSALAGGIDKTIVYRRKTKEIERPEWMDRKYWFPELISKYSWSNSIDYKSTFNTININGVRYEFNLKVFIIGFCGTVYKGVRLKHGKVYSGINYNPTYHYSMHSLTKEMNRLGIIFKTENVRCFDFEPINCPQMIEAKYVSFYNNGAIHSEYRQERLNKWRDLTNKAYLEPVLKDFQFYRAVPTYTAFQEISMYISGVIGVGEKETITISDEDMRDAKGFNEWSFKHPTRLRDL